jgi:hypothetical protein
MNQELKMKRQKPSSPLLRPKKKRISGQNGKSQIAQSISFLFSYQLVVNFIFPDA